MRAFFLLLLSCMTCTAQNALPPPNKKAPEVKIDQVLQAPAGASRTIASLHGKAIVLEFWATWCGACIEAIPHLNELATAFKDKPVVFLSITDENSNVVRAFLDKQPMSGWGGIDTDGATFAKYGILARPQTLLIDPHGILRKAVEPKEVNASLIDDLIAGKSFATTGIESKPPVIAMEAVQGVPPPLLQCLIRPAAPEAISGHLPGQLVGKEGGRIDYYGVTVGLLLYYAHHLRADRVIAPAWFDQNRYDVSITVPAGREDLRGSLLEQTMTAAFSMKTRHESRPVNVYVLSGSGSGMHKSKAAPSRGIHPHPGQFSGVATPLVQVVGTLQRDIGNTEVVDETGLSGNYDFDLHWEKGNLDSLQKALHDQLGLTLSKQLRQRDFLIVENAVQPTTL
jgi:uncharacterized protein (TIGR03435 family)